MDFPLRMHPRSCNYLVTIMYFVVFNSYGPETRDCKTDFSENGTKFTFQVAPEFKFGDYLDIVFDLRK